MRDEPGIHPAPQPLALALVDRLERVAEARPLLQLHLAKDEPTPAAHDQVELDPAGADVTPQDAVAAQAVMPRDAPLGAAPARRSTKRPRPIRRTAPRSSAPRRSGGESPTGRARGRPPSGRG